MYFKLINLQPIVRNSSLMKEHTNDYTQVFESELGKLNQNQKLAVDSIEGPVMVIAGPGTGKTQILALRIGNIIINSGIEAKNILCLTYTEAGATAMRKRLADFFGGIAYDVSIYTFHGFCNKIIKDNPNSFELYGEHDLVSSLELNQIIHEILQGLSPSDSLYNYHGNYTELNKNLITFFHDIKSESWDPKEIIEAIEFDIYNLKLDPDYYYKRKSGIYNKGDFKESAFKEQVDKFERTKSALKLYELFQNAMIKNNRYDYDDLIQWVIKKFTNDDSFLGKYQELYQYILIDEFQDTNGSQNELVSLLVSYWDQPNIFVVGDDDQAIYRFQGANVRNMIDFKNKYNPEIILLKENYRSSQAILDLSGCSIRNNKERLINELKGLDKDLIAAGTYSKLVSKPEYITYSDVKTEIYETVNYIDQLIKNHKVPAKEIAILFRKNIDAIPYAKLLQAKQIPIFASKEINVLDDPLLLQILNILKYFEQDINDPLGSDLLLYQILHSIFIPISTIDIGIMALHLRNKKTNSTLSNDKVILNDSLIMLMNNCEALTDAGVLQVLEIYGLAQKILVLGKERSLLTTQMFLEKILYDFNILQFILNHANRDQYLQILNTFFEFIKNESVKNPKITLEQLLTMIRQMQDNNIGLPLMLFSGGRHGVHLGTLHSAKGLEFDYVFMVSNTERNWNTTNRQNFKLPSKYVKSDSGSDEDARRLFYVGTTRARKVLKLSYSLQDGNKNESIPSRYMGEIQHIPEMERLKIDGTNDTISYTLFEEMSYVKKEFVKIDQLRFDTFFENFQLTTTSMDKYLKCPLAFYYEKVLRVPSGRSPHMGFGNAIHHTLQFYLDDQFYKQEFQEEKLISIFNSKMAIYKSHFTEKQFETYTHEGIRSLSGFLKKYLPEWKSVLKMDMEYKIKNLYRGVPIAGQIDRIDEISNGYRVIDYKTGKADNISEKTRGRSEKLPLGSDYFRQMIFYRLLLDSQIQYSGKVVSGLFHFVNQDKKGEYQTREIQVTQEDKLWLGDMIVDVYSKIKNQVFEPGCGSSECIWCTYVNSGSLPIDQSNAEEEAINDELMLND